MCSQSVMQRICTVASKLADPLAVAGRRARSQPGTPRSAPQDSGNPLRNQPRQRIEPAYHAHPRQGVPWCWVPFHVSSIMPQLVTTLSRRASLANQIKISFHLALEAGTTFILGKAKQERYRRASAACHRECPPTRSLTRFALRHALGVSLRPSDMGAGTLARANRTGTLLFFGAPAGEHAATFGADGGLLVVAGKNDGLVGKKRQPLDGCGHVSRTAAFEIGAPGSARE